MGMGQSKGISQGNQGCILILLLSKKKFDGDGRMAVEKLTIYGKGITDKHTHYEAYPFVGPERATITIRGDIAHEFQRKYGHPIQQCDCFEVEVDLHRNDQRVKECQNPFKSPARMTGSINSLDDIVVNPVD